MKEKLNDYHRVIIPAIFVFISIIFFYNDKFIIGSIILLAFIIYFYYLNMNEHSEVEKGKRI
ncbi:hypothetical protein H9X78_02720, partial [Clostridium saudiense]|nr:hypothetical protein [Clostridium saudiense]